MGDNFSFDVGNIFKATEQKVLRQKGENNTEAHKYEIGKFLAYPYTFDLPKTAERLKDCYPDSYYMCRTGNRMAAAGFIGEVVNDSMVSLTTEQREILQKAHDTIFKMPRDESASVRHWRTKEDMKTMHDSIQDAYDIVCSLPKSTIAKIERVS